MIDPGSERTRTLHLGPEDEGRSFDLDAFQRAEWTPGYRYELVAGRLCVTPAPNLPHDAVLSAVRDLLLDYRRQRPDVIGEVWQPRVLTRALGGECDVQPDLALFRELPRPRRALTWSQVSPFLVLEVLSESDPAKDLVRNRRLYWEVPSIQEYWLVDPRRPPEAPSLLALVRPEDGTPGGEAGWIEHDVPPGGTYRTPLLPGFALDLSQVD